MPQQQRIGKTATSVRLPKDDYDRSNVRIEVIYPLGEFYPVPKGWQVGAIVTGEKRPARPGEWYLSGAIIAAYRAPRGTQIAYHIARVVTYRTETEVRIVDLKGGSDVKR